MNKEEIFKIICDSANTLQTNHNGFFSVAQLGDALKKNNFDYSKNGFKKLSDLLSTYKEEIEVSTNEVPSQHPYAKVLCTPAINSTQPAAVIKRVKNLDLDGWGIVFDSKTKLEKLKELALPENWYYGATNNGDNPLLENYLLFTYKRLKQEGGKIFSNDDYAVFNTGLVDKRYDTIFAIFTKNSNYELDKEKYHEWVFSAFATEADRYWGLILGNNFNPLPSRTNYFASADQMYYDANQNPPTLSDDHIIIDNIDRFPIEFLEQHIGTKFDIKFILGLPKLERDKEIESVRAFLKANDKIVISMRNRLKDAVDVAVKRISWNFKTAIPLYYVRANTMSLLIPIALLDDSSVDVALVVTKMKAGGYRGMTILTLEQAYTSARLVSRPDSDWLIANRIN